MSEDRVIEGVVVESAEAYWTGQVDGMERLCSVFDLPLSRRQVCAVIAQSVRESTVLTDEEKCEALEILEGVRDA